MMQWKPQITIYSFFLNKKGIHVLIKYMSNPDSHWKKKKKKLFPGATRSWSFFLNYYISEGPSGGKRPSSQKWWLNEFKENTIYEVVGQG